MQTRIDPRADFAFQNEEPAYWQNLINAQAYGGVE